MPAAVRDNDAFDARIQKAVDESVVLRTRLLGTLFCCSSALAVELIRDFPPSLFHAPKLVLHLPTRLLVGR